MPSHDNIKASWQRGDAARAVAIGLSLEEGAAAPVNFFAAVFGEFAAVPAARGVGGGGHPRGLQVE